MARHISLEPHLTIDELGGRYRSTKDPVERSRWHFLWLLARVDRQSQNVYSAKPHREDGMITYKGLPAPSICDYLSREQSRASYAEGTEFQIGKIEMVANTGTYIDSPYHRYAEGHALSELDLGQLVDLDAVLIRLTGSSERAISRLAFGAVDVRGKAVLVHTGWDRHWRADQYFEGRPFLTEDAAEYLKASGAVLVGIDSYNIDDTADLRRPAHSILLGADIPIVEHLCSMEQLPADGLRFTAVPVKVKGMGTFPVRAYATVEQP